MVKNQSGRKMKVLRSDNGDEYTSKEFKDYTCKQRQQTPAKYFRAIRTKRSSRAHELDTYRACLKYQITG